MRGNDTVNGIITCKPRLQARFGSTMTMYAFMPPPPKVGAKGKVIHGQTTGQKYRRSY